MAAVMQTGDAAESRHSRGDEATMRRTATPAGLDRLAIGAFHPSELTQVVGVIARGMRDNPVHIAAFGDDPTRRVRRISRLFNLVLPTVGTSRPLRSRPSRC